MRLLVALAVAVPIVLLIAAPWLWQELVFLEWLGIAAGLLLANRIRGWRGEITALCAAAAALGIAFHWSPKVLAYSMQTSYEIGLLFTIPIVFWDAARLALPFWCIGRLVSDPRNAWLPAGLTAVVAEAVLPGVFPWKLGYSQIAWPVTIQGADLFGPEWPTFMLYAHAGVLVGFVVAAWRVVQGRGWTSAWTPVGLMAVGLVAANTAY
ncbi:MAG: hypothetical protein ACKOEM_19080, partial [Planctomycetia bacterium]